MPGEILLPLKELPMRMFVELPFWVMGLKISRKDAKSQRRELMIAMAACYSPNGESFDLPFDLETGEVQQEVCPVARTRPGEVFAKKAKLPARKPPGSQI